LTEQELRQYRSLLREISNQEKRIDILCSKEVPVVAGKVKASAKGFPYTEIRVSVQMEDPVVASEIDKLIIQKRKRIEECWRQVHNIEEFITEIQDSELRQILEYRYIDGMKLRDIGDQMNIDFTCISRKIRAYLNLQQKQQNQC
jgi:DNA-directed RNA polymerase specialized sigma subunit